MGAIIDTILGEANTNMPQGETISLIAGGTGLVGRHVMQQLGASGEQMIVIARRPIDDLPASASLFETDFDRLVDGLTLPDASHAYICLGTTIKKAGSREAFRRVDHDYVIAMAQLAYESGVRRLAVVSAVGATTDTNNFYTKIKGEVEEAIAEFRFEHLTFVRPGLILGDRVNDFRLGEQVAVMLTPLFNPLLRGKATQFRSIHARDIAAAMIAQVRLGLPGVHHLTYADMMELST